MTAPVPRPGLEHGDDRLPELRAGVLGEGVAGVGDRPLEALAELAQAIGVEVGVDARAGLGASPVKPALELARREPADHAAEHLQQPPVESQAKRASEVWRARPATASSPSPRSRPASSIPGIETRAPAADRDQERVVGGAEPLAGGALEPSERLIDLRLEPVRRHPVAQVGDARFGGDREPRGHPVGAEHPGHLGDPGSLAAERSRISREPSRKSTIQLKPSRLPPARRRPLVVQPPDLGLVEPEHLGEHLVGVLAQHRRRRRRAAARRSRSRAASRASGRCRSPAARPPRTSGSRSSSAGPRRPARVNVWYGPQQTSVARRRPRGSPPACWLIVHGLSIAPITSRAAKRSPSSVEVHVHQLARSCRTPRRSPVASTRLCHWRGVSATIITRRPSLVRKSRPKAP